MQRMTIWVVAFGGLFGCDAGDDAADTSGGATSDGSSGAAAEASTGSADADSDGGDTAGAGGCEGAGSCLHYTGTIGAAPFDITCTTGMGLTAPSVVGDIFNSGCGMGAGAQPLDAGAFQLGGTLAVGSFTYAPDDAPGTADPSVNLQFSGMLGAAGTGDPQLATVTIDITELEAGALVAGTFAGAWAAEPTVDVNTAQWAHICLEWNMDGCARLGQAPAAGCECVSLPTRDPADITGSFRFEVQ
ncbi:MAG: hypothetical protein AAF721_05860 [Myxococcota bacterium]